MKPIIYCLLMQSAAQCAGQSWCPPGAEWKYDLIGFGFDGCGVDNFVSDTLLAGRVAQRIDREESAHYYFTDTTINSTYSHFTSLEDGVVYQYLPTTAEWDTLYWQTATIGDRWFPPGVEPDAGCPPPGGMVEVVDTGTMIINGFPIGYRDVRYLNETGSPEGASFSIHERFGSFSVGLPAGGCVISEWPYILNSYIDEAGSFYSSGNSWSCPEWTAIHERDLADPLHLYPNPAKDAILLEGPSVQRGMWYRIVDAAGRQVMEGSWNSGMSTCRLDVSDLPASLYVIRCQAPGQAAVVARFSKE